MLSIMAKRYTTLKFKCQNIWDSQPEREKCSILEQSMTTASIVRKLVANLGTRLACSDNIEILNYVTILNLLEGGESFHS